MEQPGSRAAVGSGACAFVPTPTPLDITAAQVSEVRCKQPAHNAVDEAARPCASKFCGTCSKYLCELCASKHSMGFFKGHCLLDAALCINAHEDIHPTHESVASFHHALQQDAASCFMAVSDEEPYPLLPGERFWWCLRELDPHMALPTVAAIGPSGSGKSSVLRLFLDANVPRPIPAGDPTLYPSGVPTSTSCDSHAYMGTYGPGKRQVLCCDTEGLYGDAHPAAQFVKAATRIMRSAATTVAAGVAATLTGQVDLINVSAASYSQRRVSMRDHGYPRFLYLFSDVMFFVTRSSPNEVEQLKVLQQYANSAAMGTTNTGAPPDLIILYNCATPDFVQEFPGVASSNESVRKLTAANPELLNKLHKLYNSVNVCFLPHIDNFVLFCQQRAALTAAVENLLLKREALEQAAVIGRWRLSRSKINLMLGCMARISASPDAAIDLAEVAESVGLHSSDGPLTCYFDSLLQATMTQEPSLSKRTAYKLTHEALLRMLPMLCKLWTQRHEHGSVHDLLRMVSSFHQYIEDWRPCEASHEFPGIASAVDCEDARVTHVENTRLTAKGAVMVGEHRSSKTFEPPRSFLQQVGSTAKRFLLLSDSREPCHWSGNFHSAESGGAAITEDQLAIMPHVTPSQFRSCLTAAPLFLRCMKSSSVCVLCMFERPVQALPCGHKVCAFCLQCGSTCPLDATEFTILPRSVPSHAGFRLWAVGSPKDVEVVAVTAALLHARPCELFDFIAAPTTHVAALVALSCALKEDLTAAHVSQLQTVMARSPGSSAWSAVVSEYHVQTDKSLFDLTGGGLPFFAVTLSPDVDAAYTSYVMEESTNMQSATPTGNLFLSSGVSDAPIRELQSVNDPTLGTRASYALLWAGITTATFAAITGGTSLLYQAAMILGAGVTAALYNYRQSPDGPQSAALRLAQRAFHNVRPACTLGLPSVSGPPPTVEAQVATLLAAQFYITPTEGRAFTAVCDPSDTPFRLCSALLRYRCHSPHEKFQVAMLGLSPRFEAVVRLAASHQMEAEPIPGLHTRDMVVSLEPWGNVDATTTSLTITNIPPELVIVQIFMHLNVKGAAHSVPIAELTLR